MFSEELTGLSIADLDIWLDTRESGINFILPECHKNFVISRPPRGGLYLQVRDENLHKKDTWNPIHISSETWGLWQERAGRFVFTLPDFAPPKRQVFVSTDFKTGEVIGEFSGGSDDEAVSYPLKNIEIKIFINWMANYGDLVLHAVGVRINEQGYCFVGSSGSGKSTLARALLSDPDIEILGEDNIVLRSVDQRFWIYGTPWHLNSKMCSNNKAPLEKIYFLDRSIDPGVKKCDPMQGITRIMQTAFIPYYRPQKLPLILEKLNLLSTRTSFGLAHYQLGSDPMRFFR